MPKLFDILDGLEKVLPILGTMAGHPELGILGAKLLDMGEQEIRRRQAESGLTRSEILADAALAYQDAREENEALAALGHEDEQTDDPGVPEGPGK